MSAAPLPKMFVLEESAGVIRFEGADALTGILAGQHAREIARVCNAHAEALREIRRLELDLQRLTGISRRPPPDVIQAFYERAFEIRKTLQGEK